MSEMTMIIIGVVVGISLSVCLCIYVLRKYTITVCVSGGLIQSVDIPDSLNNVIVVVKDYDTEGDDEGVLKDDDGEYKQSKWTSLD